MQGRPIDHVVVVVPDLEEAGGALEMAGFHVTPRSDHPFGTSNRLVMVPASYLELMSVTRPEALPESGFARFVADNLAAERDGPLMMALRSDDVESDRRHLADLGLPGPEALRFGRTARLPDGSETRVEFECSFTDLRSERFDAFYCRHLTRDQVWHPDTLVHPNGADILRSVTVADPGEALGHLAAMAGVEPALPLQLGLTHLTVGDPAIVFAGDHPERTSIGSTLVEVVAR